MTEIALRNRIETKVNKDNERDFEKIYLDNEGEEEVI